MRIDTPFTNEHFAAFVQKMVGHPYWYGTCFYKCTDKVLDSKKKQYPDHYGSSRMSKYRQDIANKEVAADCVGGCKGYAWTNGGEGVLEAIGTDRTFNRKNGTNGCPDKSANGMFEYAKKKGMDWGVISTIPEIPGLAVRKDGHIGYYIGDGEVVEWMGFSYGCRKTKLKSRPWTHWFKLPFIDYGEGKNTEPVTIPSNTALGTRQLVRGSVGDDVRDMQELLMRMEIELPDHGACGEYNAETESAVKYFQRLYGLTVDGKYGEETHKALMSAVADYEAGRQSHWEGSETTPVSGDIGAEEPVPAITEDDGPEQGEAESPAHEVEIVAQPGGKVNVRVGNSTEYARITTVSAGMRFPYIATAENGWLAVVVGAQVGWVSPKYAKRIGGV